MNLKDNEIEIMDKINQLFIEATTLFNELSPEAQEEIHNYHREGYSLNHCIRWGGQATEDILSEFI